MAWNRLRKLDNLSIECVWKAEGTAGVVDGKSLHWLVPFYEQLENEL
jgi:hypothetical protein